MRLPYPLTYYLLNGLSYGMPLWMALIFWLALRWQWPEWINAQKRQKLLAAGFLVLSVSMQQLYRVKFSKPWLQLLLQVGLPVLLFCFYYWLIHLKYPKKNDTQEELHDRATQAGITDSRDKNSHGHH